MSTPAALHPRPTHTPRRPAAGRLRLAPQPRHAGRPRRARHALVERPRLVAPLVEEPRPLAILVAPAGFGKTTVLEEWRAHDDRPFAWVTVTAAHDEEPDRLVADIALALPEPGPAATFDDLAHRLAALPPHVLVLDDLHNLRSRAARTGIARLAAHVPGGSTLALSSRCDPDVPLGRLRAQDDVVELRADRLAMTASEGAELLAHAGLALGSREAARLLARTAGWPAALRLAARAVREQEDPAAAVASFDGADGIVGEYVREEVLAALAPEDRAFLRRTSVLERLHGPACDALLDRRGSAGTLHALARAHVPLTPVDRSELAWRAHPLLAEALRAELRRVEPELEPELRRRASAWHEAEGDVELAIEQAVAAHDADHAAALLGERAAAFVASGRCALVEGWLRRLGDEAVAARPGLALAAAMTRLAGGERDAAERWATLAGRDEAGTIAVGAALVRAAVARDGVATMGRDARRARAATPAHGPWRSLACLVEGSSHLLAGRADEAGPLLDEGARLAIFDAPIVRSLCLAELAFLALERRDAEEAAALASRARAAITRDPRGDHPLAALTFAVSALTQTALGGLEAAREDLGQASRRLAVLPDAPSWYGALVRLALARVALKLSDAPECRRLLSEAGRLRGQTGGATALEAWIDAAWGMADDFAAGPVAFPATLTMAELRVLRFLPSHLTFREIAARLHVSANTVKTQAHAVYRKLDASSRSEAVAHAVAIGLVES